jgi:uncharacterized membrane protein
MTDENNGGDKIKSYVDRLARALRSLPEADRADIVAEIRSHLDHRARENRLDETMRALGSPDQCARGFLDEMKIQDAFADGGPSKTVGALVALASRRVTAAAGLFLSGVFFLLAIGFAISAVAEVVIPAQAGLWVNEVTGFFIFGTYDGPLTAPTRELLGRWMIPVSAGLCVSTFVIGQWLARVFVRLMARKRPRLAV